MRRYSFIVAVFTLALCGCNRVDNIDSNEKTVAPTVYHLSIQASMDSQTKGVTFDPDGEHITSRFEVGDKIYVYNKTQDALARHRDNYLATPIILTSAMIHNEGQTCTLEGDLSFVKWKFDEQEWESVTPEEGDEYCLYYLLNDADYSYTSWGYDNYFPRFDYSVQNGSATSASQCDFAAVTDVQLVLNETTLTVPDDVRFTNLQSMFRQKLTFKNSASETVTPIITALSIDTENGTLINYHNPTDDSNDVGYIYIDNPVISDGNIYLALAFYYPDDDSKNDKLILTAADTDGNVYRCIKAVPTGFQNGKYYYGNCTMEWDHQIIKPTVTRSDGGDQDELEPGGAQYDIYEGTSDEIAITISGSSYGYYFYLNDVPATVTLTGNGTAVYNDNDPFVYNNKGDLTIVLESNYAIICPNHAGPIWAENGNLKLKTKGATQTLTVTANIETYRGLYGDSNYDRGEESDVASLAADGFTVTCSDRTDNLDGTYTWVYTVTPNS